MIKGLNHIGIAVQDLDVAVKLWQQVTGAIVAHRERILDQRVEVVILLVGSLKIELIQTTSDDSPVARFLASHGEGIHHISLESDSAQGKLDRARASGARLMDEAVRVGAEHSHIGFVHPHSLGGVLMEFVDHAGHQA